MPLKVKVKIVNMTSRFLRLGLNILLVTAIVLLSIDLAGATSNNPGIPDIYLVEVGYDERPVMITGPEVVAGLAGTEVGAIVAYASLRIRVGYFGICIDPQQSFLCSNNATSLALQLQAFQDPLNMVYATADFQHSHLFPWLIIIAIIFIAFSIVLNVLPLGAIITFGMTGLATILVLSSAVWQQNVCTTFRDTLHTVSNARLYAVVSGVCIALIWGAFVILAIATLLLWYLRLVEIAALAAKAVEEVAEEIEERI